MNIMNEIYQPQEDSFLLQEQVKKYAKGIVLDIGTGSGIQALTAAKNKKVKKITAIDINKKSIDYCKKNIKFLSLENSKKLEKSKTFQINKKITFLQSNLFNKINKSFDTIIFNPPYLPQESENKYLALEGGKKGYEIIEKFLNQASNYLNINGIILIVFSSFTNKQKIDEIIERNLLEFQELSKQHIFFEDLYVYLIKKTKTLEQLEKLNIRNIKYLAHGKRGIVFTADYKNKNVAIKTKKKQSQAIGRVKNEAKFLKIINKQDIGPKLILSKDNFLIYEFIRGEFIKNWIQKASKKDILRIFKNILEQCHKLDKLNIDKKEMTRPVKHIIIGKKITMIDFERAHYAHKPKNVTQFCQFLMCGKVKNILERNGIKIDRTLLKNALIDYKKEQDDDNFFRVISCINY